MTDLSSPESDAGPGELAALLETFAAEQEALTELVTHLLQAHQALMQIVDDQQSRLDELEAVVDAHDPAVRAEAVRAPARRATRAQAEQARRHAAAVMSRARTIHARSRELLDGAARVPARPPGQADAPAPHVIS